MIRLISNDALRLVALVFLLSGELCGGEDPLDRLTPVTRAYLMNRVDEVSSETTATNPASRIIVQAGISAVAGSRPEEWLLMQEVIRPLKDAIREFKDYQPITSDEALAVITVFNPPLATSERERDKDDEAISSNEHNVIVRAFDGRGTTPRAVAVVRIAVVRMADGEHGMLEIREHLTFRQQEDRNDDGKWDYRECWVSKRFACCLVSKSGSAVSITTDKASLPRAARK